jgi:hypothetical protein
MSDRPDWLPEIIPATPNTSIDTFRRVASVILGGVGLLFLVPPIYATISDWKGANDELAWSHLFEMLPCCSVLTVLCFVGAWRIRRDLRP